MSASSASGIKSWKAKVKGCRTRSVRCQSTVNASQLNEAVSLYGQMHHGSQCQRMPGTKVSQKRSERWSAATVNVRLRSSARHTAAGGAAMKEGCQGGSPPVAAA